MDIRCYQDLEVWRKAMDLVIECYRLTAYFPKQECFGLSSQLQRAAVSVPANIAEGRGRYHTRDFLRFLSIASGSLAEIETHVMIAVRLEYLTSEQAQRTLAKADEVGRMLRGLQKSLRSKLLLKQQSLAPSP